MQKYSKFVAALLAALAVVASSGLLHGSAELATNTVIAAIGAAVVYLVPNGDSSTNSVDKPEHSA